MTNWTKQQTEYLISLYGILCAEAVDCSNNRSQYPKSRNNNSRNTDLQRKAEECLDLAKKYYEQTLNVNYENPVRILGRMVTSDLMGVSNEIFLEAKFKILEVLKEALQQQMAFNKTQNINVNVDTISKPQNFVSRFRTISSSLQSSSSTPHSSSSSETDNMVRTNTPKTMPITSSPVPLRKRVLKKKTVPKMNKKKMNILDVHVVKRSLEDMPVTEKNILNIEKKQEQETYFYDSDNDSYGSNCFKKYITECLEDNSSNDENVSIQESQRSSILKISMQGMFDDEKL